MQCIRPARAICLLLALLSLCGCAAQPIVSAPPTPSPSPTSPSPTAQATERPDYAYVPLPAERNYVKRSEMSYRRPLVQDARALTDAFMDAFDTAPDAWAQIDAYVSYSQEIARMQDNYVYALVGFYRDTNADTQTEFDYCEDFSADISEIWIQVYVAILSSPYIQEITEYLGEDIVDAMARSVEMFEQEMVDIYRQIARLRNEYTLAQAQFSEQVVHYDGLPYTAEQLIGQIFYDSVSYPERAEELNALLVEHMDALNLRCDQLYIQMLELRTRTARIAGFDNYAQLALSEGSYDLQDIKGFIQDVRESMIPIAAAMRARAEDILGEPIDITNYSLAMHAPSYAAALTVQDYADEPAVAERKRYDAAMQALSGLMPLAAQLVEYLEAYQMIDVFSSPGKSAGAFTVTFPYLQQPFVFSNGVSITTLFHEAGHALNAYCLPKIDLQDRFAAGSEINEIHSMGLEMLMLESYELLYGDTAPYAVMSEIFNGLSAILNQTMYFEFELTLCENPDMTRQQRNELFNRLHREYAQTIPGLSIYDDYGGYWVMISHFFEQPLYTIDYSLAQMVSFEIYERSVADHEDAEAIYMDFMTDSQQLDLRERLANCGLRDPFERENIDRIASMLREILLSQDYWVPLQGEVPEG